MRGVSSRRQLPKGARFEQVIDLFELPPEVVERTVLWCGGTGDPNWADGWMPLARLVQRPYPSHETHLSSCPATMVVIVAERREP